MSKYYGGLGPMTNAVLWAELVIFALFVGLRLYTRISVLKVVGHDDYVVAIGLVLYIVYIIFVTIGTQYGIGRCYADVGDDDIYFKAVMLEVFSQASGIVANGVAKCAVGVFLLRIVRNRVQLGFIWAFLTLTIFIMLFSSITVVVQCIPVRKTWNPTVSGTCWLAFPKVGFTLGAWYVITDFAFAIVPWFIVWDLNMRRKEKLTVACGLSLGVFAGICGIVRSVALNGMNKHEYIHDTVPMLIWSATENTVTIVCSCIPVLRPLYLRCRYGNKSESRSREGSNSHRLPMYNKNRVRKYPFESTVDSETKPSSSHHNTVDHNTGNESEENILRPPRAQEIRRTDQVDVSFETCPRPDHEMA